MGVYVGRCQWYWTTREESAAVSVMVLLVVEHRVSFRAVACVKIIIIIITRMKMAKVIVHVNASGDYKVNLINFFHRLHHAKQSAIARLLVAMIMRSSKKTTKRSK